MSDEYEEFAIQSDEDTNSIDESDNETISEETSEIDDNEINDDDIENEENNLEEENEENDEEDEDEENDEEIKNKKNNGISILSDVDSEEDEEDDEDEDGENYLQKFDKEINHNYIVDLHPECLMNNYDEIISLSMVVRDKNNNIVDDLHKTLPYLTKYEKARVLGQRAKQINSGAKVFVDVPDNILDGYIIAELELKQKRIPFIIRRPLSSGGCEYWSLKDLEIIGF